MVNGIVNRCLLRNFYSTISFPRRAADLLLGNRQKSYPLWSYLTSFLSISDMAQKPPWKEAASLIIATKTIESVGKEKQNIDYQLLMVQRSERTSFMPNTYVFPGGVVETADFSSTWWTVYEKLGISKNVLQEFATSHCESQPPIVTDSITSKPANCMLTPIALRIAALRETFEETGVLLLTDGQDRNGKGLISRKFKGVNIKMWQEIVHNDPLQFTNLCLELEVCPDIWLLDEWSNWLTPTTMEKRRYDTIFYICCLTEQPDVYLEKSEVTLLKWCHPEEILKESRTTDLFLAPPQVYDLSRIATITKYDDLCQFVKERKHKGCERWMPYVAFNEEGHMLLLPGDDFYPKEIDYLIPSKPLRLSAKEVELKSKNINRFEIEGALKFVVRSNVTPALGHLKPVNNPSIQSVNKSYL